jgi:hypothetical protein
METPDPLLERIVPVLAKVSGMVAIALGGSRASGAALGEFGSIQRELVRLTEAAR